MKNGSWLMTQRLFRKLFHVWKLFPEILLCHYPNLRNFKFHIKSLIWEKVSGKSPESCPESLPIWVKKYTFNNRVILVVAFGIPRNINSNGQIPIQGQCHFQNRRHMIKASATINRWKISCNYIKLSVRLFYSF